jgi:hypothetical protein
MRRALRVRVHVQRSPVHCCGPGGESRARGGCACRSDSGCHLLFFPSAVVRLLQVEANTTPEAGRTSRFTQILFSNFQFTTSLYPDEAGT